MTHFKQNMSKTDAVRIFTSSLSQSDLSAMPISYKFTTSVWNLVTRITLC